MYLGYTYNAPEQLGHCSTDRENCDGRKFDCIRKQLGLSKVQIAKRSEYRVKVSASASGGWTAPICCFRNPLEFLVENVTYRYILLSLDYLRSNKRVLINTTIVSAS